MKPRVRGDREGFLTERSEGVGEAPTAHPCTVKNARASMRAPLTGLISQPPPPQRGPQDQKLKQERATLSLAAPELTTTVARSEVFASAAPAPAPAPALGPRYRAEQRSRARGKGANVRAHGCASSRRPENGEQRRVRRSRAMLGSPFFWLLFFGEAKKSDSAAAEADEISRRASLKREKRKAGFRPTLE